MRARLEQQPQGLAEPAAPPLEAAAPAGELLVARGVTKRWRGADEPVVRGVDLDLPRGSSSWVAGRNGVGKTTLLRILAGVIELDAGTISLDGLDSHRDAREYRARVGLLSAANAGLFARLSVRRHLEYWARIAFVPRERREEAVSRMLQAFSLEDLERRRVDRLSMGQRQRLRIAMTFLHAPDLVLLDEAHNSLDEEGMAMLSGALADLVARGGAALWCSPDSDHPPLAFDRRFTMRAGCLEAA